MSDPGSGAPPSDRAVLPRRGTPPRGRARLGRAAAAAALLLHFAVLPCAAAERAVVLEVVDGDTLRVRTGAGTRTVRLIGVDAPETAHPTQPPGYLGAEAASFLGSLCGGRTVHLEPDVEEADRHGRILRYVSLADPPGGGPPSGGSPLVNIEMIRTGHARAIRHFAYLRREEFLRAEEEARRAGRGIWRDGGLAELSWLRSRGVVPAEVYAPGGGQFGIVYRGVGRAGLPGDALPAAVQAIVRLGAEFADADFPARARDAGFLPLPGPSGAPPPLPRRPEAASAPAAPGDILPVPWEEAHRHVGRLVAVEGTIVRVHRARGALYLNFHPNWKRYASVVVSARDLAKFPPDPGASYLNRRVRVRGEVSSYRGTPEIAVTSPAAIAVLD